MGIHTAVFFEQAFSATTPTDIQALTDQVMSLSGEGLFYNRPLKIVAAYAAMGSGTTPMARLRAPTLSQVVSPWIRPISSAIVPPTDPNATCFASNPLPLPASEVLYAQGVGATGGLVAVWLMDKFEPIPPGPVYRLRFTQSSTASLSSANYQFQTIPISFTDSLPAGKYAIVGFEAAFYGTTSPSSVLARLVVPGQVLRPGTLTAGTTSTAITSRTASFLYDGSLGVIGTISSYALPQALDVLCTATTGTLDEDCEGYLALVKVAEADGRPCNCQHS